MLKLSRRDFLKMGASLAALMGFGSLSKEAMAEGLETLATGRARVIWLSGQSCSGCSVSFLNSAAPRPATIVTRYISLAFHGTIGAAQGETAIQALKKNFTDPGYILVIEGSIPDTMPEACMFADEHLKDYLKKPVRNAGAVLAVGSCATFGGMPAAEGNLTGAISVKTFMEKEGIDPAKKLIAIPCCPTHPESVVGCIAYVLAQISSKDRDKRENPLPKRDPEYWRPEIYYTCSIHAECPRYHYYQNQKFSGHFGDEHSCLFKLGCLGPLSFAGCPRRQWNNNINWCIRANAPCISCSSEYFCSSKDLPFYRKSENYRVRT